MAVPINNISRHQVKKTIATSEVFVDDIFIDGTSLQETLKTKYSELFLKGRFKNLFIVYLGNTLTDIYHSNEAFLQSPITEEGRTNIAPLYGCADSCCVYLYVKVRRSGAYIYWEAIGRNTAFVHPSQKEENAIDWLPSFEPLVFDFNTYNSFFKK
jgi:hypothetical protein